MQTYVKNGARALKLQDRKKIKKQVKVFYAKLAQINELVQYINENEIEVNEENINDIMPQLVGRELDSMEKTIVLAKLADNSEK